jgi:hypothetical protein
MRPIINAVESALGFNRVVLAARLSLPVFPNEQTFSGAVDMSQRCQRTELALCEAAALGDDLLSAREEIQTR